MSRPFISKSLSELKALCKQSADVRTVQDVLGELEFRKTQGAKKFETELRQRVDVAGNSGDLFGIPLEASSPKKQGQQTGAKGGHSSQAGSKDTGKPRRRSSPKKPKFAPTPEQQEAVEAFMTGDSLKVTAFAGAGKTSTLVQMANVRDGSGLYLAFNRAIAEEASAEFPSSVDCRTTHSVALRAVRSAHQFSKPKLFNAIKSKQLAKVLELKQISIAEAITLTEVQQAHLLLSTIRRFCQSGDTDIQQHHIPKAGRLIGLEDEQKLEVERWAVAGACKVWSRMLDANDDIPLGHDGYLKLWSLSDPVLEQEFILLDEAQDTNPAVMSVLEKQNTQMVYVGDSHQQIYAWRGAVDAMSRVKTQGQAYLTQSFRFGPEIAEAATSVLRTLGERKAIRGNEAIRSSIGHTGFAGTVLARTNAMVISEVLDALNRGIVPHIVGGTDEILSLVSDVFNLMDGKTASHSDFFGFTNWDQVVAFSDTDEGEDLKPFVSLVQKYGPKALWASLKQTAATEDDAGIVISTAHKAKGRQWKGVRIADDFAGVQTKIGEIPQEESRLFYVAITRAQEKLDIDPRLLRSFTSRSSRPKRDNLSKASQRPIARPQRPIEVRERPISIKLAPEPVPSEPQRPTRLVSEQRRPPPERQPKRKGLGGLIGKLFGK